MWFKKFPNECLFIKYIVFWIFFYKKLVKSLYISPVLQRVPMYPSLHPRTQWPVLGSHDPSRQDPQISTQFSPYSPWAQPAEQNCQLIVCYQISKIHVIQSKNCKRLTTHQPPHTHTTPFFTENSHSLYPLYVDRWILFFSVTKWKT